MFSMKMTSFLNFRLSFILAPVLPFILIACASTGEQTSYALYHPQNMKRLNSDVEECKRKTIASLGTQEGEFEVVTLIKSQAISSHVESDEYPSAEEESTSSYVGGEALKVLKAVGGMGLTALGVVTGDFLAVTQGIGSMENFDQEPVKTPRYVNDSQMVLNVVSR